MAILFHNNDSEDCGKLIRLISHLKNFRHIDISPKFTVTRNFPDYIESCFPSLLADDNLYQGLNSIITYYENRLGIHGLIDILYLL